MDRRNFVKASALVGLRPSRMMVSTNDPVTKLTGLSKGSTIGLITPAGALSRSAFEKTLQNMRELGFEVKYSNNIRTRSGFLAGTDEQRVNDLMTMYKDPGISGIICARGGYGTTRLLEMLDYDIIRDNPKPLIGYSDITALHTAIYSRCNHVGYHGPVGASTFNDFTVDYFTDVLMKGKRVKIKAEDGEVIRAGTAQGKLIGGNLTLLASLVGTPFIPSFKDHIVFMEEIGESAYRVDRMLTQLLSSGALEGAAGFALGYFTDCEALPEDPYYEYSIGLNEIFRDRLGQLGVPVLTGFPFGHEAHNATLPIGIQAELDTTKQRIRLLESPLPD